MIEVGKVTVADLKKFFHYRQLTGDKQSLQREILVPDINRPGLELAGFFDKSVQERIIIIGNKEKAYIKTRNKDELKESFEYITSQTTPCIVMTHDEEIPEDLIRIAQEKNFPVLMTSRPTNMVVVDIIGYLDEKLAKFDNVHGVLLSIYGNGILLTGESGIGKSEIALDLVNRGHMLVADDRVDCYRVHNEIIGRAPDVLQKYLELRGVGIINVVQQFGAKAFLEETKLEYVIHLEHYTHESDYERLGNEETYDTIMGLRIPKTTIPVNDGRNMAVVVEAAVTNFSLKKMGIDTAQEFDNNVVAYIERNK